MFEYVESCNFIIQKDKYDEIQGMNEDVYVNEDLELCYRINKKYGNNKILYAGDVIVFHKDRNLINFLKQRFVYGLHINITLKHTTGLSKLIPLVPFLFFLFLLLYLPLIFLDLMFLYILLFLFVLSFFLIFYDLKKFNINFTKKFFSTLIIYLANLSYVAGNISYYLNMQKIFAKKIYRNSK